MIQNYEDSIEKIKLMKEDWVRDHLQTPTMPTYSHGYRDGEIIGTAFCMPDRDVMIDILHTFAAGLSCSEIFAVFEVWHSTHETNPVTGQAWETGDMQYVAENYPDALEKGWVTDALSIISADREDNVVFTMLPFKVVGDEVVWDESDVTGPATNQGAKDELHQFDGYLVDVIKKMMAGPEVNAMFDEHLEAFRERMSPEVLRALMDCAAVSNLMSQETDIAFMIQAEPGSERARIIEERLGENIASKTEEGSDV